MPRDSRTVLRSLYTPGSEKFKTLRSHEARHLYVACLLNADDEGRLEGACGSIVDMVPWLFRGLANHEKTKKIAHLCLSSREKVKKKARNGLSHHEKVKKIAHTWLSDLKRTRLIDWYKQDGKWVIQVNGNYSEEQDWQGVKRKPSKLPPPPGRPQPRPPETVAMATSGMYVFKKERKTDIHSHEPDQPKNETKPKPDPYVILRDCQRAYRRAATERGLAQRDFGHPGRKNGRLDQWLELCGHHAQQTQAIVDSITRFVEDQNPNGKKLFNPVSLYLDRAEEYIEAASSEEAEEPGEFPVLDPDAE